MVFEETHLLNKLFIRYLFPKWVIKKPLMLHTPAAQTFLLYSEFTNPWLLPQSHLSDSPEVEGGSGHSEGLKDTAHGWDANAVAFLQA